VITLIEIDGFKTFQNFKLELLPFQVIVGPNGAGKSNLFDALHILRLLAETDIRSAFQQLRGNAAELFTTFPNGHTVNPMTLAVEMIVNRTVQDNRGAQANVKYMRMRYDLEITRRTDDQGYEQLCVTRESLKAIARGEDQWAKTQGLLHNGWLPKLTGGRAAFISTAVQGHQRMIHLHQDGHGGRKSSVAEKVERTVLSGVTNTEFPHAFAAREDMCSWKLLQMNPKVLREPGSMLAPPYLSPDARMQAKEPYSLTDVSTDLATLVPEVLKIHIEPDLAHTQYVLKALMQDRAIFSSRVLSDTTLRMLALVTLKNDPEHHGVLCFEEPENGVHPSRLKHIGHILRQLATDFQDPAHREMPLRQVLVNTHSPGFISHLDGRNALLFAYTLTRREPATHDTPPGRVTRMVQVKKAYEQLQSHVSHMQRDVEGQETKTEDVYTYEHIQRFLASEKLEETRRTFMKG